jgi:GT2 family glycosyltransferase
VIPTYNGLHLVRTCLTTLVAHPPQECDWRLVVVDDASSDGTASQLRAEFGEAIELVARERNGGFATACNAGAEHAGAVDLLVFLNNDTIPIAGWLDALVAVTAEDPRVGAVGAKLLFPNGTVQHAGVAVSRDGWPRHLYTGFPGEHPAVNRPKQLAAVTAACILVERELFEHLDGFDTAFLNGYEDIDFCHRITASGRTIRYEPRSVLYHLESVTRWPDGVPHSTEENDRLYRERWAGRIPADDVQHWLDDGLIDVEYTPNPPQRLAVSPLLATVLREDGQPAPLERLLELRSGQVLDLQSARIRSAVEAMRDAQALPRVPGTSLRRGTPRLVRRGTSHRLGAGSDRLVSLVMPLMNAGADLREILPTVLAQKTPCQLEFVGVDSASKDDTLDVLAEFDATTIVIDPADFDHGLTRNIAAEHAAGDVILFLNGRSRPLGDDWLGPLLAAIDADPSVAGVCSRIVPRADADLLTRRDGLLEVSGSSERWVKRIDDWDAYRAMPEQSRRLLLNFHTVSAAVRRDVLLRIPFQSVRTIGEDLLWAREVLESGLALVHEPDSVAAHSHNYPLRDWFERNVDDGAANRDINGRSLSEQDAEALVEGMIAGDWSYLRELGLSGDELEQWQRRAALRRSAQVAGQWLGANHPDLPPETLRAFSRVANARRPRS